MTEITLSNDAYYLITANEEPLDEQAYAEAEKVLQSFPNGLSEVSHEKLPGGMIKVLIDNSEEFRYELYWDATTDTRLEVSEPDNGNVQYRWTKRGKPGSVKSAQVLKNPFGIDYFLTEKGSTIPLKSLDHI